MGLQSFEKETLQLLNDAVDTLAEGFSDLPDFKPLHSNTTAMRHVLLETAARLQHENPYFHPLYAGQMLKPPHPLARAAYALTMLLNPNDHVLDASKASSPMEKEAVAALAGMFGWQTHLGHLTGGGTMANLEALWVAGQVSPGQLVVASQQAHYTHERISSVLNLEYESIPVDQCGRMSIGDLEKVLNSRKVGTVVATMGTTALGAVDPLPEILELSRRYGFRIHADAAYGGYFTLASNLAKETRHAFDRLKDVDSIVIDPHKHGLQPYGCGCVLFRDPDVGAFYQHESPYTYFSSDELHLGEISLECSRPGAAAVALWATQRLLPLQKSGSFADMLRSGREAALELHKRVSNDKRFVTMRAPELDILAWAPRAESASRVSRLSRRIFAEAAKRNLHVALADLPVEFFDLKGVDLDQNTITCLRSVLMKPEHLAWIDQIWTVLSDATSSVLL